MRQSRAFIPTLKEAPAEAQVASHKLLLRAALVRQLGAGIYSYLPLALRSLKKVEQIIREEMAAIGAQEFYLPALHPAEVWQESGRWELMGESMFRLKDRRGSDYCLGMTHEEIFTALARGELRSYRELPQVWYQIQTKFRDEVRPKSGLLRVRQFTMKDAYSLDVDEAGLDQAFEAQRRAYHRIFSRCGLDFVAVEAHSGAMGGSASIEFMVRTDAGEDDIAACAQCGYTANTEKAISRATSPEDGPGLAAPERFHTPGVRTIEGLQQAPHGVAADRQLKTLIYVADGGALIAIVRGDQQLNEAKLQSVAGAAALRPALAEEVRALLGASPGSLGGVGTAGKAPVFVDESLAGRRDMVTGANQDDYHLRGVDVARDLAHAKRADLRSVVGGEGCTRCSGVLAVFKGLEIGHIFKLGTRYASAMRAMVLNAAGELVPIVMGSYGIGVERVMAAAIEQHHDDAGIRWPMSIAPFHVALLCLQPSDAQVLSAAEALYEELQRAGVEVLYDDRDERPGVKFKDADLIGLPIRLAVGKKGLADGKIELKLRTASEMQYVPRQEVVSRVRNAIRDSMPSSNEPQG